METSSEAECQPSCPNAHLHFGVLRPHSLLPNFASHTTVHIHLWYEP